VSGSLPTWLVERLRAENPDGVTRSARLGTCEHCRHPVLRGLDEDICALAVTVSPIELNHFGEYLALARGLRTYALARRFSVSGSPRWEIDNRDRWQIENPRRRYAVVPEHKCGLSLPHWKDGVLADMKPPSADYDGPPPF
jgi:hypothetical protein